MPTSTSNLKTVHVIDFDADTEPMLTPIVVLPRYPENPPTDFGDFWSVGDGALSALFSDALFMLTGVLL